MADQELKLTAVVSGADKAAGDVQKIADAEKKLADASEQTGAANKASGDTFRELNGILRDIHPGLGRLADGFSKAIGLAGDLASTDIQLGSVLKSATEAIKNNASALLLVGAGGAVVFGINAIIGAIAKMGEESRKATEELKRQREALDDIFRARAERQQAIETISDVRRGGGLSKDASARAASSAESVGRQFTALEPEAVNRAAGLFGDAGLSNQQLAEAAFLIQSGRLNPQEGASNASLVRQFNRSATRFRPRITEFFAREMAQGQGTGTAGAGQSAATSAAIEEVRSKEPGSVNIESFIRNLPGGVAEGIDPKKLAAIVKGVLVIRGETLPFADTPRHVANIAADRLRFGQKHHFADLEAQSVLLAREGIEASPSEVRIAEFVLQQLQKGSRQGATQPAGFVGPPAPIVVNQTFHQQNMRNFGSDGKAFQKRVTNGENLRYRKGEG